MAEKDAFSQIGYIQVVESAANTLTFNGLSVFSNVLGQKGMVIHRVEYQPSHATIGYLAAAADNLIIGLSGDDSMTTVSLKDPEVYDYNFIDINEYGTSANAIMSMWPLIKDFTGLPGKGLLVPADRLFAYLRGESFGGEGTLTVRFWYTILDLNAQQYLELAQAMRVLK